MSGARKGIFVKFLRGIHFGVGTFLAFTISSYYLKINNFFEKRRADMSKENAYICPFCIMDFLQS